ncbi:MAG: phenylacetate--CoA ligase family protein, partial [Desulfonatronovibrionaceae bacterium]
ETREPLPAGETGEVVVTPFNQAYPLIRFATGDLSFIREDKCPCGRTSARLGGILGRVDDTVKVKGQFMYPSQIGQALAVFPEIRAWKVITANPQGREIITLHILGGPDVDAARISKVFQDKIKLRPEINITDDESLFSQDGPRIEDQRTWG